MSGSGYKRFATWQWIAIYIVIGAAVYGGVYYFYLRGAPGSSYGAPQTQTMPGTMPPSTSYGSQSAPANSPPLQGKAAVGLRSFTFAPSPITVKKGTTVTWTNYDIVVHSVTSNTNVFASTDLKNNDTFSYTFNDVGTFPYHCSFHPTMTGVVQVVQ